MSEIAWINLAVGAMFAVLSVMAGTIWYAARVVRTLELHIDECIRYRQEMTTTLADHRQETKKIMEKLESLQINVARLGDAV